MIHPPRECCLFSERLSSVAVLCEPLRGALLHELGPAETPELLLFTPEYEALGIRSPKSVLAVTNLGWILVQDAAESRVVVYHASFEQTLWFELNNRLLYGRLRLAYAESAEVHFASIEFNTVMNSLYLDAVMSLLPRMRPRCERQASEPDFDRAQMQALALKFRSAVIDYAPVGESLLRLAYWPSVVLNRFLWKKVELAPEGLGILTSETLVLVQEEFASPAPSPPAKARFGWRVHFLPRSRIARTSLKQSEKYVTLTLFIDHFEAQGTLEVMAPLASTSALQSFIENVV